MNGGVLPGRHARAEAGRGGLDSAAGDVAGAVPSLSVRPDAGQSSGEVGTALQALAEAVRGISTALTEAGSSLRANAADYDRAETEGGYAPSSGSQVWRGLVSLLPTDDDLSPDVRRGLAADVPG